MIDQNQKLVFLQNDRRVVVDFGQNQPWTPDTTVLQYLRSLPDRKGTKEGCAEGDCGACTVVLGELNAQGEVVYKAVDSCILFLPMLHGKQLLTVEDLGTPDHLHPVQHAMVDCDGSQCGYCTPGFVMSLFALYKQPQKQNQDTILDGLTGNLCRCTGYRSILAAANQCCNAVKPDAFSVQAPATAAALKQIALEHPAIHLDTAERSYFRPQNLSDALALRQSHPNAQLVCGATDMGLVVTKKKLPLEKLLDLGAVAEMKRIEQTTDGVWYGAALSLEQVKLSCGAHFPALESMLAVFGSRQIREQGTLGGNIANASPIGDTPPVLMALDASVELRHAGGSRIEKLTDFVTGYRQTSLAENEIITRVFIPFTPQGTVIKSYKISKRKDLDISTVSGGFRLRLEGNKVAELALYYGGMAAMTKRPEKAEAALLGQEWSESMIDIAMDLIDSDFTPINDARSGKEGRRLMARNLLKKFWADTAPLTIKA